MAERIIDGTLFNVTDIMYTTPKATPQGAKSVNILNKSTNTGIRMLAPLLLTWGASDFVDATTGKGNGKYEMSLQFPSSEYKTVDAEAFLVTMQNFENKIKADALTYSKDWFGKVHKNADVINALWTPMLKYSRDKFTGEPDMTKSPILRVKLPLWEGVWKCEIYDEDNNKLFPNTSNPCVTPLDFIQKGINVAVLLQCGGLWFANGKFGCTWKLLQAVVQKPRASLTGQCFIKLKASDKEKLKTVSNVPVEMQQSEEVDVEYENEDVEQQQISSVAVDDSDEEEEETEVASPVTVFQPPVPVAVVVAAAIEELKEEPKKAVVKKIVKKKVVGATA